MKSVQAFSGEPLSLRRCDKNSKFIRGPAQRTQLTTLSSRSLVVPAFFREKSPRGLWLRLFLLSLYHLRRRWRRWSRRMGRPCSFCRGGFFFNAWRWWWRRGSHSFDFRRRRWRRSFLLLGEGHTRRDERNDQK